MSDLRSDRRFRRLLLAVWFIAAVACGDVVEDADSTETSVATELGLTGYVGAIDPIVESSKDNLTTYTFDAKQGPICMRGDPYRMSVRETGSKDLLIFLQGGGACWSEFCFAVTKAPPGVPGMDILRADLADNPVRDWNVVYLPYCDGSFFAGDVQFDDNLNDKGARYHHGLANLTAALEVAAKRFAKPRRILLAGSSGGAYGLLLGAPMVRHYFPDAEIIVMADSGIGLARDGEQAFIDVLLDEFNVRRFLPKDCADCIDRGHLTGIVGYYLGRDSNIRVGLFSSWYDSVLSKTFLQTAPKLFAQSLQTQTDKLHKAYPKRFRRFVVDGTQHTSLLGNPTGIIGADLSAVELPQGALMKLAGGGLVIQGINKTTIGDLSIAKWLTALVGNDLEAWQDVIEAKGAAPD